MYKAVMTLITGIVLCAPAFADNQPLPQPKGKRPAVSFGARDIQSGQDTNVVKKSAPAPAPAATSKPAKSGPSTKNYQ
ncbi:MAG: hypothetical protein P4L53_03550 [Candidatus Obscuribacterales bacterium]|nr:hypothetical protein [Candidatus Obscuribacterales bacterium]